MKNFSLNQVTMMAAGGGGAAAGGTGGTQAAPDFGNAGSLTVRADLAAVALHLSLGEFLHYSISVKGVSPVFTFSCIHRTILSSKSLGGPKKSYAWDYFKHPGESDAPDDTYTVAFSFVGAPITYTLVVTQCDSTGKVIQTLKDLDCSSTDPTDFFMSGLRVVAM